MARRDLVVCLLKLFAVREQDQKLIGVVSFEIDWQLDRHVLLENKVLHFQKCIDPAATITISAKLQQPNSMYRSHTQIEDDESNYFPNNSSSLSALAVKR